MTLDTFAVVEEIVRRFGPLFETAGYAIVVVGVLLERSMFVGLVIPGDVILALGGTFAARGDLRLEWVIVFAILAAITGESIGYGLGRRYGEGFIKRLPLIRGLGERLGEAQAYFEEHGGKTVAIGRFATAAGAFIPFAAGLARMRYSRFLLFDVPAIIVWAGGIALVGYYFGRNLETVDRLLSGFGGLALLLLAAFVAGYLIWRRRQRRARA